MLGLRDCAGGLETNVGDRYVGLMLAVSSSLAIGTLRNRLFTIAQC
jgi:hypothetical protein